jgi:hypothetical protein
VNALNALLALQGGVRNDGKPGLAGQVGPAGAIARKPVSILETLTSPAAQ